VARLRRATATSAGGLVFRLADGRFQLVVGRRRRERDGVTWTLPKGTPAPGESLETTALREVAEETGLQIRILRPFDAIRYAFVRDGVRYDKTVHYFFMAPVGGRLEDHDAEFEVVRWVPVEEALGLLTFETERDLVARAARVLEETPDLVAALPGGPADSPAGGPEVPPSALSTDQPVGGGPG
jgi:8-oxo-dGTP pyrophosphatase MutT (NUDIX family)